MLEKDWDTWFAWRGANAHAYVGWYFNVLLPSAKQTPNPARDQYEQRYHDSLAKRIDIVGLHHSGEYHLTEVSRMPSTSALGQILLYTYLWTIHSYPTPTRSAILGQIWDPDLASAAAAHGVTVLTVRSA